jgi:preprotein translocase subunit SecA
LELYAQREKKIGAETMRAMEREVYLQVLDSAWMQHLENMDHFRQGVGLRGYGQRDPLVEYRKEGQAMFERMQAEMDNNITQIIFRAEPPKEEAEAVDTELTRAAAQAIESATEPTTPKASAKPKPVAKEAKPVPTSRPATKPGKRISKAERKRKKKARRR